MLIICKGSKSKVSFPSHPANFDFWQMQFGCNIFSFLKSLWVGWIESYFKSWKMLACELWSKQDVNLTFILLTYLGSGTWENYDETIFDVLLTFFSTQQYNDFH